MIDAPKERSSYDEDDRQSMILGYRAAFVYAAVSAGLGLGLCVFGVSVPDVLRKAKKRDAKEDTEGSQLSDYEAGECRVGEIGHLSAVSK